MGCICTRWAVTNGCGIHVTSKILNEASGLWHNKGSSGECIVVIVEVGRELGLLRAATASEIAQAQLSQPKIKLNVNWDNPLESFPMNDILDWYVRNSHAASVLMSVMYSKGVSKEEALKLMEESHPMDWIRYKHMQKVGSESKLITGNVKASQAYWSRISAGMSDFAALHDMDTDDRECFVKMRGRVETQN